MKKDNPAQIDDQSPEARALKRFPRHDPAQVAQIAALLVSRGQVMPGGYLNAAQAALDLLDAVGKAVELREKQIAELTLNLKTPAKDYLNGILYITGQSRRDRAEELFQEFASMLLRVEKVMPGSGMTLSDIPPASAKELTGALNEYEKSGFRPPTLSRLRQQFERWKPSTDGRRSEKALEKRRATLKAKEKSAAAKKSLGEAKKPKRLTTRALA